mgnify:CR=1 FL=1
MSKYIDRESAISLIKQYGHDAIDGGRYSLDTVDDLVELANRIEALPSADVVPVVHGRWISKNPHGYEWTFVCSNCGYVDGYPFNDRHNYCPHCGATMDEKEAVYD